MTTLMVYAGSAADAAKITRTGGIPLVPAGFSWPACRSCAGPMQFLAQVMPGDLEPDDDRRGVLSIFMCQNDPGMCDDWSATEGGNQALIFPVGDLIPAAVPAGPATLLGEVSAVRSVPMSENYDEAYRPAINRIAR
jgi:hypothetical protein